MSDFLKGNACFPYCGGSFRKCMIFFKEMLDFLVVEAPIGNA